MRDRLDILQQIATTTNSHSALGVCMRCHDTIATIFCVECDARYCTKKNNGNGCDTTVHVKNDAFRLHRRFQMDMLAAPGSVEAKMEAEREEREVEEQKIKSELDNSQLRCVHAFVCVCVYVEICVCSGY